MSEATTDRELLDLAARAAGIVIATWSNCQAGGFLKLDCLPERRERFWNPLADDGDALRLAVKLGLAVIPYPIYSQPKHSVIVKRYEDSLAVYRGEIKQIEVVEVYRDDPAAATRRAITRAAAEIGKEMK